MDERSEKVVAFPGETPRDVLTEVLRRGAGALLREAIETEVSTYLAERAAFRDAEGRQAVVRNGYLPEREVQTALGPMRVRQARVRDRRSAGDRERFEPGIVPRYLRKSRSLEEWLPWLYLKGVSTGDFGEALEVLLGQDAKGLSAATITRLKSTWEEEYGVWSRRSLKGRRYVYVWADGIHCNIRLEDAGNQRQCLLVLIGATPQGRKELIAVVDGYRESEQSWTELLLDLRARGLEVDPSAATGDGALGFWAALRKLYPATREQRCWVHKTANVLDKMPKSVQPKAKGMLHEIWMAPTRRAAETAFDLFLETYRAKYPGAVACLEKDRAVLLTFYDFPAEHWIHLRTTNPIESTFATVRLRTAKTKGSGSRIACLTMVFKLVLSAQKRWRVLNGHEQIAEIIEGVEFVDGMKKAA